METKYGFTRISVGPFPEYVASCYYPKTHPEKQAHTLRCDSFFIEPPVFSKVPSPVDTLKGSDVILQCEIAGTPPFEVAWFKDRRQVRSSKKFKVTTKHSIASLHILNLESQDTGEYQCKAMNEVGSDTCTCPVKFKGLYARGSTAPPPSSHDLPAACLTFLCLLVFAIRTPTLCQEAE